MTQPINVLLADTDYRQYLLLKEKLSVSNGFRVRILWCGEPDQYLHAMQSGIYDLVFLQYATENLFVLEQFEQGDDHTPVVMMADDPNEYVRVRASKCGALDVLCRPQPDATLLRHYLVYADLFRRGELRSHAPLQKTQASGFENVTYLYH